MYKGLSECLKDYNLSLSYCHSFCLNLLGDLVKEFGYSEVVSWLFDEAVAQELFDLGDAVLEVLESLLDDRICVFLRWHQAVEYRKIKGLGIAETHDKNVEHVLRHVSETELLDLLGVASLQGFVKHSLQMLILELDQLSVVAQTCVGINASVLEPVNAVTLILLKQDRLRWLDPYRGELVALAHAHGIALQDPAVYLAVWL